MSKPTPPVSQSRKYTAEQIQFIVEARLKHGLEWSDVAREFGRNFSGGKRTPEQMRHAFRSTAGTAVIDGAGNVESHPFTSFTHSDFKGVHKATKNDRGKWFVTSASPVSMLSTIKKIDGVKVGTNLYMPGWKSVQTWIKENDGELVLLPLRAHMPPLRGQPSHYDHRLVEYQGCFANEFHFNENLRALDVHLNPQQMHPLTGLHRLRGGKPQIIVNGEVVATRFNQDLIFAHAKQDMEPVATGNGSLARYMYSTGCITLPEYLPNRIGRIAADGHVLGGLIVEMDGGDVWVRQVQFGPDGSFYDIDGKRYRPDGRATVATAKSIRIGDTHGGREDKEVIAADVRLADVIEPEEVYLDDVLDGASASHHTEKDRLSRALRPDFYTSIEKELEYDRVLLEDLSRKFEGAQIVIVSSNHHDHFIKYIREGRYLKDDPNYAVAHRMVVEILNQVPRGRSIDDVDVDFMLPLRKRVDPENKFIWLGPNEDRYVDGIQMGSHGHLGVDGAKGSPAQLEKTFGDAMLAHYHAARILGRLYVVGHSSKPRHGYNQGPSKWRTTAGVTWPSGQKQLVTIINGRYGMDDLPL